MSPTIWHCHIAVSLDGRIARLDGSFDWLEPYPPQEFGIEAFMAGIDAIVMGRATYDIERRMDDWPHPGKPTSSSPAGPLPTRRRWSRRGRVIFPLLPTSSRGAAADGSASRAAASSSAA